LPGYGHADASLELPDNPGAIEELAKAGGFTTSELAPGFLLIAPADEPPGSDSLVLTADRVEGMGSDQPFAISEQELERLLLVQASPISTSRHLLYPDLWFAVYYWPSVEGAEKELYAVTQSSGDLHPQGPPSRGLAKHAIEHDNGRAKLRPLWHSGCGGPVAELELDFDGDDVIDVVCLSALPGDDGGVPPFVVISGANGARIGEINGEEVLVTQSAGGLRVRSMGTESEADSPRKFRVKLNYEMREGKLVVEHSERREIDVMTTHLEQPLLRAGSEAGGLAAPGTGERLVGHFVAYNYRPTETDYRLYAGIPRVGRVGEKLGLDRSAWTERTHVLLDYRPPRATAEPATPR
jgi:hypothetical protein